MAVYYLYHKEKTQVGFLLMADGGARGCGQAEASRSGKCHGGVGSAGSVGVPLPPRTPLFQTIHLTGDKVGRKRHRGGTLRQACQQVDRTEAPGRSHLSERKLVSGWASG